MTARLSSLQSSRAGLTLLLVALVTSASAQTRIVPDSNKYSLSQDVELGQQAAAEARKELPMLSDDRVDDYVDRIGRTLVGGIPPELRHEGFRYAFDVVNQKEINAFALPGGPMFVNRGMIEAAEHEAQVAGVMAHEIAHVALRHGTAQATKGQKFQIGAIAGQILGAIVGGTAGSVISQGSQIGLGTYFLKYGREYERQADLLGAQILARAGYDPRQMANMFKIIQSEGGGGGPEWMSSHPDPGNRYNAILKESASLRVQGDADTGQFASIRSRLAGMSPAYTAEQIAQGRARSGTPTATASRRTVNVAPPSAQLRTYSPAGFLRVSVPSNWSPLDTGDSIAYAPEGASYEAGAGQATFTHGIQIGVAQGGSGNLERDTQALLNGFARSNPRLKMTGRGRDRVAGRDALTTRLANVSDVTGQPEYVSVSTTYLRDGSVLYLIGVAPEPEARSYEPAFQRVRQALRIEDR